MKKIYLIDANSFIYRMFFWLPEFQTKSWVYVNAVFGIARFFLEQLTREKPDYIIFIKDAKWKNFRHYLDKNYKATRDRMPDNLRSQVPIIEDMVFKMWVPIIEIDWYEADDVIATLAHKYSWNTSYEVDILTWDKDLHSLVSENVRIYDTMKKKKYSPEDTFEKFWVWPKSIIDYLAIVWDKSDNIPGIDGFWPKKAVDLINIIWSVEDIYNLVENNNLVYLKEKEVKELLIWKYGEDDTKKIFGSFKWKTFEKLINSKEDAILSKKLATVELNVELIDFKLDDYKFSPENYLNDDIKNLFRELEFNSLLNEEAPKLKKWDDLWLKINIIWDNEWLDYLFNKIKKYKEISFDTETTSLDIMKAKLVWISIYLDDDNIYYINRMHNWPQVSDEKIKEFIKKLFGLNILIIGHNIKYDLEIIDIFMNLNKELIKNNDNIDWQTSLAL